jgi:hypothetical protein
MAGRVMRDYVALPDGMLADGDFMRHWLGRALAHASALPPKPVKKPKSLIRSNWIG